MKNAGVRGKKRKRDFCRGEGDSDSTSSDQLSDHRTHAWYSMYVKMFSVQTKESFFILLIFIDKAQASLRCLKISFVPFSSSRERRLWEANEQEKMHKIHFQSLIKYFSSSFFVRFMKIQKLKCFVFIWIFYLPFFCICVCCCRICFTRGWSAPTRFHGSPKTASDWLALIFSPSSFSRHSKGNQSATE